MYNIYTITKTDIAIYTAIFDKTAQGIGHGQTIMLLVSGL